MLPSYKLNEPIILLISSSSTNPRQLSKNFNILLHRSSLPVLSSYDSLSLLCQSFANFFSDKIHKLHTSSLINCISTSPHFPLPFTPPNFSSFTCVTTDEVSKLLSQPPDTNCDLDPILTSLLKQCSHILLHTITNVINLSLSTGIFPDISGIDQASSFYLTHISLSFTFISFTPNFILFDL